jgi:hypothetical protein
LLSDVGSETDWMARTQAKLPPISFTPSGITRDVIALVPSLPLL